MILSDPLVSKSGRIALVPPQEGDDAAVAALRSHPETRRYVRFFPSHFSVEEQRARRVTRAADPAILAFTIYALSSGSPPRFVGETSLLHIDDTHKSCEIGIYISPGSFRGGLATDALYTVLAYVFEQRKLHRAEFVTAVDNVGMRGWLDIAGATLEGIKGEGWSDGKGGFTDVCLYSILEGKWVNSIKTGLEGRINRVGT
ncbi:acyl-CoA N-acyltransferase [Mycena maculata]|uniref:Acyl-CoA N-acyltransferase n=1 Tax=Mycena maculata TaxID=230809 RepID=A0AAD7MHI2_9AGAR|nr:acyl-CoA N-acyltransferase [Mycena maculata]